MRKLNMLLICFVCISVFLVSGCMEEQEQTEDLQLNSNNWIYMNYVKMKDLEQPSCEDYAIKKVVIKDDNYIETLSVHYKQTTNLNQLSTISCDISVDSNIIESDQRIGHYDNYPDDVLTVNVANIDLLKDNSITICCHSERDDTKNEVCNTIQIDKLICDE